MARPSITGLFNRKARKTIAKILSIGVLAASTVTAGLLVDDKLRDPGESILDDIEIMLSGGNCAYPKHLKNPRSPQQKKLAELFEKAKSSPTGALIMNDVANDGIKMCFDAALNKEDACGFYTIGSYNGSLDLMRLNPADRVSDIKRVLTLVHEGRHHSQSKDGANPYTSSNVPDHERIILKWLKEADARMASIVFAWEQKQQGVPEYYESLRDKGGHREMVAAFEKAITAHPDDMRGAIQAAIKASYEMDRYERNYANSMMSWMERTDTFYEPGEQKYTVLYDRLLMALGDIGTYGNYMDEQMMQLIRNSFTPQDFRDLAQLRKEAGGTRGAACGPEKKKPGTPEQKPQKPVKQNAMSA